MISIIIPAYNEEQNIEKAVKEMKKLNLKEKHEVVVVNDGSTDKTTEKAKKAYQVVTYKQNQGKGYAMRKGIEKARGNKVIFTDADQYTTKKIHQFINKLEHADIVIGKRDFTKIPWVRRINIALTKLAILLATGKTIQDPICGIRAMYKKDFQKLNLQENRFEVESEINLKALKRNMSIQYVPIDITYPKGTFEVNKLNWTNSLKIIKYLVKSVLQSWTGTYGEKHQDK